MTSMLTAKQLEDSIKTDPLNRGGGRNLRNTPLESYNCGGFALSIYDWICPYIRTDDEVDIYDLPIDAYTDQYRGSLMYDLLEEGYTTEEIETEILARDIEFLLRTYPFLEQVDIADCAPTDTVIAYRIFVVVDPETLEVEDTDFHFKVRINDFWFEKMGAGPVQLCQLDDSTPWVVSDEIQYTSLIAYFRINK